MIPSINSEVFETFEEITLPSNDFRLDSDRQQINGMVSDLEQLKQTIAFILNTERYDYLIYPWSYGVEFKDLFGQPMGYVIPEIERRITEALTQDKRISSVSEFEFEKRKKSVHVTFTVSTNFGAIESEVDVNV